MITEKPYAGSWGSDRKKDYCMAAAISAVIFYRYQESMCPTEPEHLQMAVAFLMAINSMPELVQSAHEALANYVKKVLNLG